ncbi:transcriptional regulator, TetR family protein [Clostridium sartagoforme AAU1]|uniref:Transcriptional regulator, TetR family protein n=1 Tax=Clostridium sartagoforme AAU1 TaxID=1202534 RepID=R9CEV3_9CLOT|nr:TetR/AcrR family transcriptional regulator [Clostridium sartagoforme]EOR27859.1 transcriptional regulator, TetR family protein [Clostridium sartagoforme AAU1]
MKYNNDTSKKIMKVALKLFSEQGYYPTTTKQIAEEAGVNELTIFRHFGSKSNLFQVTTEHYVVDSHVDYILNDTEELNFEDSMMLISKRIYDLLVQNTKLYKVQMKLADNEKDFVRLKLSRKLISVLIEYFIKLNEENITKGNPEIMAVTLINSLLGAFTVELLSDNTITKISWEDLVKEHTRQFIALYKL